MGWSFDDWARENGLTSSGARIRKDENLATDSDVIVEPQPKRRCLDIVSSSSRLHPRNCFEKITFLCCLSSSLLLRAFFLHRGLESVFC